MLFTEEHEQVRRTIHDFIENEINPHVDAWEEAGAFPIHELFKQMGDLGLLGITKPVEYGGLGLDFSYEIVFSEELGVINCSGLPISRVSAWEKS
jgi:citronellyl-CoA dehydrogenase